LEIILDNEYYSCYTKEKKDGIKMKKSTEKMIMSIFNRLEKTREELHNLANYSDLRYDIDSYEYCKIDGYCEKIQEWITNLK